MVRYYGRARQRTGAVNRKQTGLKLSGSGSGVGRSYLVLSSVSKRVTANLTVCKQDGDKTKRCTKASECETNLKTGSCCGGCVVAPSHTAQSSRGIGRKLLA